MGELRLGESTAVQLIEIFSNE